MLESYYASDLLKNLCGGRTISEISDELGLEASSKFDSQFGDVGFEPHTLLFKPVTYLLNRDSYETHTLTSPHASAGAFSASVIQSNKTNLLDLGGVYSAALTDNIVNQLNAETGLDFGANDKSRFGDLELLTFPSLDDHERDLLSVTWDRNQDALVASLNPLQMPEFDNFTFHLKIYNAGQLMYSKLAEAKQDRGPIFEHTFAIDGYLSTIADSTEIEVFGSNSDNAGESTLCSRWKGSYIREMNIQTHIGNNQSSPVKFDWLEHTTKKNQAARVKAALIPTKGRIAPSSRVGGREQDSWVPVNQEFGSILTRLRPPISKGRFFLRWGPSDGEGRLQFVEWFRALFKKYSQHQIVIFDPYFDSAGLSLVLLSAIPGARYLIFTSLPDPDRKAPGNTNVEEPSRLDNLVTSCERSPRLRQRANFQIYGLKHGRLHDRYILVIGPEGLPVTGFNLSNSLQKAAENHPMLVTPIPGDVLLQVERYKSELLNEVNTAKEKGTHKTPPIEKVFDSATLEIPKISYEPLAFLNKPSAGDVLSKWTETPSLQGLRGKRLKLELRKLELLHGESLRINNTNGLRNFLLGEEYDSNSFQTMWEVLGELIAHSPAGDKEFPELKSQDSFLGLLTQFLERAFLKMYEGPDRELAIIDSKLFKSSLTNLCHDGLRPHHMLHATKYTALTWADYFAIKLLWWYAPQRLISTAEDQLSRLPDDPGDNEVVRLSLLSQILSEISLSVEFSLTEQQLHLLLQSDSGILQWMALNGIQGQLRDEKNENTRSELLALIQKDQKILFLGWLINQQANTKSDYELYSKLVSELFKILPEKIDRSQLIDLVDSLLGHMRQLGWAEPWLFQDIALPLLKEERSTPDDACEIWLREVTSLLDPDATDPVRLFQKDREGRTLNICAFLFAYSGSEQQDATLKRLQKIARKQCRVVQQPLASTSNWSKWDDALNVSMWILIFTRWSQVYLKEHGITNEALNKLSEQAHDLAMTRPLSEWRSEKRGLQAELACCLSEADTFLADSPIFSD